MHPLVKLLFSFEGRIGRRTYLFTMIGTSIVYAALLAVIVGRTGAGSFGRPMSPGAAIVELVLAIGVIWISLAAGTKRLHDTGWSGWWQLSVFIFVPVLILVGVTSAGGGDQASLSLIGVAGIMGAGLLHVVVALRMLFVGPQSDAAQYGGRGPGLFDVQPDGVEAMTLAPAPASAPAAAVVRSNIPRMPRPVRDVTDGPRQFGRAQPSGGQFGKPRGSTMR